MPLFPFTYTIKLDRHFHILLSAISTACCAVKRSRARFRKCLLLCRNEVTTFVHLINFCLYVFC